MCVGGGGGDGGLHKVVGFLVFFIKLKFEHLKSK